MASLHVLLIGGSGFMGRRTADAMLAAGHRVSVLSRGNVAVDERIETLVADRRDSASLARVLEGRTFDFTVDFLVYDAIDVETLLLVPYAALGRYVMISTGQVYLVTDGTQPPYREQDMDGPVIPAPPEDSPEHGSWAYGVGKRRAERALLGLRGSHGMRSVALRLPIVQGEGDGTLRLWAYLERMLDGGPLVLPDGGTRLTRHVDVADVAATLLRFAESEAPRSSAYNLAQPDVVPLRELLERIAHAAGVTPRFVDASWDEALAAGLDRWFSPYAGPWSSILDPSRAAAEWGFLGTRTADYVPRIVRWHLEHRPKESHFGYPQRALELEFAAKLGASTR